MKHLIKLLVIALVAVSLCSCNAKWDYSPMDKYIKTSIEIDSLNKVSKIEGQRFIDSVNCK